ncbi:hypothetical protein BS78_K181600 [Paspalum vaginatum]|uniref:Uncharacterized protein n=1 Tax=Paspalum vaginatum TaxID=158149 RepID=A0A9W8CEB1_9POAL|nr:hypothetical protein BS78_K181600 [Paspalum vaginatum]
MPVEWTEAAADDVEERGGSRPKCSALPEEMPAPGESRPADLRASARSGEIARRRNFLPKSATGWKGEPCTAHAGTAAASPQPRGVSGRVLLAQEKAFDFLKALKNPREFSFVNKQMNHIMESFHLANRNLTLGLYSDGIFMAVLDTLVGDGACRRLSQEKKEMLETSMDGLPYSDNMSPEKIKMLC